MDDSRLAQATAQCRSRSARSFTPHPLFCTGCATAAGAVLNAVLAQHGVPFALDADYDADFGEYLCFAVHAGPCALGAWAALGTSRHLLRTCLGVLLSAWLGAATSVGAAHAFGFNFEHAAWLVVLEVGVFLCSQTALGAARRFFEWRLADPRANGLPDDAQLTLAQMMALVAASAASMAAIRSFAWPIDAWWEVAGPRWAEYLEDVVATGLLAAGCAPTVGFWLPGARRRAALLTAGSLGSIVVMEAFYCQGVWPLGDESWVDWEVVLDSAALAMRLGGAALCIGACVQAILAIAWISGWRLSMVRDCR